MDKKEINEILGKSKHLHFIGIGGISMSSLAMIAKDLGFTVTGSDRSSSEATEKLENAGIKIIYAHKAENVINSDAVVYTAAVHNDNPEMAKAIELGLPLIKRAEFLGYIMQSYKNRIGVAGMHGKSTTTSMISEIFMVADADPTVVNGVKLKMLDGGAYRVGSKEHFIFEACEYTDSFLSFFPSVAIVLNIDRDHVDYFLSMEQTVESFAKYINLAEKAIVNIDDDYIKTAIKDYNGELIRVSTKGSDAEYNAKNIEFVNGLGSFDAYKGDKLLGRVELSVPGEHSILDALVSIVAADMAELDFEKVVKALRGFKGAHRRFEYIGEYNGIDVYDDYAHHPSEIMTTLEGVLKRGYNRVWCVFQPHTYSRTAGLLNEFALAFKGVHKVVFADIFAARETDTLGVSSKLLAQMAGENALYIDSFEKIAQYFKENAKPGDLILTMGAGDVNKIADMIVK
ncbi:MAG: UDP-N-acetylmuramate--L-alanine ligase [Clostridia bacterium]|nr:UDP-N-acetylmuramate--L-alanine ligase [Clostridia bacterium]